MSAYLQLGQAVAYLVTAAWAFAAVTVSITKTFGREPIPAARFIYHELRPFYLPAVVGAFLAASFLHDRDAWTYITFGTGVLTWLSWRNEDDDDRWKRRRKRLAEKVSVVGGRLAVVPAGAR